MNPNWIIFQNYLYVFILPFLAGAVLRFALRPFRKGWILTLLAALCAAAAWIVTANPPIGGSELYGLRALMLSLFTLASFLVGILLRRKK